MGYTGSIRWRQVAIGSAGIGEGASASRIGEDSADPWGDYDVWDAGTKGLPPNRRVKASMAPTAFFLAVEM